MLKSLFKAMLPSLAFFSSPAFAAAADSFSFGVPFAVLLGVAILWWAISRLRSGDKTLKNYGYQKSRYDEKRGILLKLIETEDNRVVVSYQLAERGGSHNQCSFCNELLVSELAELDEYLSQETMDDICRMAEKHQSK